MRANVFHRFVLITLVCVALPRCTSYAAERSPVTGPTPRLQLPGENFELNGRPAFVFLPEERLRSNPQPWIFYAPTLPGYPDGAERWMHQSFLEAGIAVAGIDVGEAYGSPASHQHFDTLYEHLVTKRHFARKAVLFGRSRGGLWVTSWASAQPDRVAALIGIYPVFDFKTYPGIAQAAPAYSLTAEQLQARESELNPIRQVDKLARAQIPVALIHGDEDTVIPLEPNSAEFVRHYKQAGAESAVKLIVLKGQGHNFSEGFFHSQELVDHAIHHARLAAKSGRAQNAVTPDKVFVGYVFRAPDKINFSLYTHLCHAFVTADADGVIRPNSNVPNRSLVADAHANGVKVLISLGGWGWDKQFAEMVTRPEAEQRYLRSVMDLVDSFDYDGIDLDWEYPDNAREVEGFARLCRAFRKELDALGAKKGRPMLLTMAAAANISTLEWLPNELLLETMNWINVMTYDMAGEWTDYAGHHAPLFASSKQPGQPRSTQLSLEYLLKRGLPGDRLALGIPLYGKGFSVGKPYASTRDKKAGVRPPGGNYAKLVQLKNEQGWQRQWYAETKNPWLIAPDGGGVIGYDDPESAALKAEWAVQHNLRGVFFWEVAGDRLPDGSNPVQQAASDAIFKHAE